MSNQRIKVTDRRMFTPDGELRDDYKDLGKVDPDKKEAEPTGADGDVPAAQDEPAPTEAVQDAPAPGETDPEEEEPLPSGAVFQDLIGLLAQSASVYLGQSSQRIENRAELLEMARMHVDLLEIVKRKTRGNLDAREEAMLDDALYQLRMAFVQRG